MLSITEIFKKLRKTGLLAVQRYKCCSSCAGAALGIRFEEKPDKYRGAVFYHRQDWDTYKRNGKLYLRFGTINEDNDEVTYEIGHEVMDAFREGGWKIDWNGSPHSCVVAIDPYFEPDCGHRWR